MEDLTASHCEHQGDKSKVFKWQTLIKAQLLWRIIIKPLLKKLPNKTKVAPNESQQLTKTAQKEETKGESLTRMVEKFYQESREEIVSWNRLELWVIILSAYWQRISMERPNHEAN